MNGAIFVFVGDVSLKRARELVLARFKGWRAGGGKIPEATPPDTPKKMQVVKIDRPLTQTTVMMGTPLAQAHEPRFLRRARDELHPGRGRFFQQDHGKT